MSLSSKLKYEIVAINNVQVTVDVSLLVKSDELYFNATEMARRYGKKPIEWTDSKQANEYIDVIVKVEKLHLEDLIRTVHGGRYKGTWLHKKLALPFARWCSVEFEYHLDKWIASRINEEQQRKLSRKEAKTGFRPLTDAIQSAHKDPKHHHFSTECNLVNRLVTGMDAKQFKEVHRVESVRDALDAADLRKMGVLQRQNTSLIELGFSYEERKDLLQRQADKFFAIEVVA